MKHALRVMFAAAVGLGALALLLSGYWLGGVFAVAVDIALLSGGDWFIDEFTGRH